MSEKKSVKILINTY